MTASTPADSSLPPVGFGVVFQEAIQYFSMAGQFNHAVRLAKAQGMDSELMTLALQSSQRVQVGQDSSTSRKGGLSCSKTVPFFSAGAGEGGAGHPFDGGPGQRLGARRFSVR